MIVQRVGDDIDRTHLPRLMVRSRVLNFQDYKDCYAL
jgi:hypothetical protein